MLRLKRSNREKGKKGRSSFFRRSKIVILIAIVSAGVSGVYCFRAAFVVITAQFLFYFIKNDFFPSLVKRMHCK